MNYDLDRIISFMKKFSTLKADLGEQDATGDTSGGGEGTASSSPAMKKWESGRKFGKTYMNDPKYKWNSDRAMGKTYMGDPKYKWETGLTRGHANPVP